MQALADSIAEHAVAVLVGVALLLLLATALFWRLVERYAPACWRIVLLAWNWLAGTRVAARLRQLSLWHVPAALVCVTLIVFVGSSRVLLQVHYLSDVLAGYASGAAWVALWIAGLEAMRRRERDSSRGSFAPTHLN